MIRKVQRGNFRNPSWLRFEVLESRVLLTGSPLKQDLSLLLVPDHTTPALIAVLNQPEMVHGGLPPAEIGNSGASKTASSDQPTQNDPGLKQYDSRNTNDQTQPGNTTGDGRSPGNPESNQSGNDSGNNSKGSAGSDFDAGRFIQAMMQWEKDKAPSQSPDYTLISKARPEITQTATDRASSIKGGLSSIVGSLIPDTQVPVDNSISAVVIYPHQAKDGNSGGTTGEYKEKQNDSSNSTNPAQPANTPGDGRSPGNPSGNQSGNDSGNNSGGSGGADFDAGRFIQAMMQWEKDNRSSQNPAYSLISNARLEITQTATGRESAETKDETMKGGLGSEENPDPNRETEMAPVQVEAMASENREPADKRVAGQSPVVHLNPQGAGLLASVPSLDLVGLEQGVLGFFDQLETLGNQIAKAQEKSGLPSWLVALATAGAVLEITRRQIKPARTEMESAANCQDQTWTWFVDATDPHSHDPA
ncbi:MAG TPA: hypothetical protein VGY77_01795 [Gemmataceae bacterium]|nr:hypothetical protein [Gemmataceae bacterium]